MRSKRRFDVVGVDRRETSGLLGKLAERVLRRPEFLQQFILHVEHAAGRAGDAAGGRVRARHQQHRTGRAGSVGDACRFHEVGRHPRQAARIDRVVIDVGARRCRDRILRRANDDGGIVRAEHVADGKVEPFAEEQHGLAASSHAAQKLRCVLQRVQHSQRASAALELRGVRCPAVARRILRVDRSSIRVRVVPLVVAEGNALVVRVEPIEAERPHAPSLKFVDRTDQQLAIGRELLRSVTAAARVDNGAEVVGRHVLADELARGVAYWRAAHRADIEIVEHDDVDAPVERLAVGAGVGWDCPALDNDLLPPSQPEDPRARTYRSSAVCRLRTP